MVRPATRQCQCRDPLSEAKTMVLTRRQPSDDTNQVVSRDEGERGLSVVLPETHLLLGERHTTRLDAHQHLSRLQFRQHAGQRGPQAISVNAIARELGVSGPALYRYFTNRDELWSELVEDSYRDFYASLAVADNADQSEHPAPGRRLHVVAAANRGWALAEPHRYRLLFQAPVPGFNAQDEKLVHAAQPAMNLPIDALVELESESPTGAGPDLRRRWRRSSTSGHTATAAMSPSVSRSGQ